MIRVSSRSNTTARTPLGCRALAALADEKRRWRPARGATGTTELRYDGTAELRNCGTADGLEVVHPAAGHPRHCALLLRLVGDDGLGGEEQGGDRRGVLQRGAGHLGGVDD